MNNQNKMKVAMICHFSNTEVRSHLDLDNRKLYGAVRRLLGMPVKGLGYGDIAPWDTDTIRFLNNRDDIELTVISAHRGLKKSVVDYTDNGVHYFFVKCDIATMLKRIIPVDSLWRRMNPMVGAVKRIINNFYPDLVVLMGAENAYYSSSVLGIKDFPVYVLCQTIYNNPERSLYGKMDSKNASTELEIIRKHRYFGVYCKKHFDLLRKLAPHATIFKFGFPTEGKLLRPTPYEKKYDFVNFAHGMSVKKGYTDAIEATAIVKKRYPHVLLNLVGSCDDETKQMFVDMVDKLELQDNVVFTPFFEKQSDMFLHIQKSRFALLPCKMDNVSGTMMQAMQLGLPIVVYKTTGTPAFNKEKECALIAEHCNVEDLAAKMIILMDNPEKAEMLCKNAREYQVKIAEKAKKNGERLVENFKAVIANFKENIPIPNDQLFNPEKND